MIMTNNEKENEMTKNEDKNGFTLCAESGANGFRMTFANGWSISVQWSSFNYCANKSYSISFDEVQEPHCTTAECAVWDANGDWFPLTEHDDVIGWQTPDEVAALITRVAAFPVGSDMLDEADTMLE